MSNKKPAVIALRSIRKASNISRRLATKSAHFLGRVENKTDRIILKHAGGASKLNTVTVDEFVYRDFPYILPIHPALPLIGQQPSVTVFVPSLSPRGFYGGIATLLIVSATLAKKLNYHYRVVQTSGFEKNSDVIGFLAKNGIEISEDKFSTLDASKRSVGHFSYLPLHPDDVVVVSAWWDAHVAAQLPLKRKFVYLIQDYEPIFYNNGDLQQFAESTYLSDKFTPLCNTELLYSYFKKNGYKYITENATWFEPAVGLADVKPKQKNSKKKSIFLYGRPQVHRNMYYSAIQALDQALKDPRFSQYEWEIYSAGQSDIPNVRFSSGHTMKNLGKMNIDDYYKFIQTVDIAISPMLAPHPNYPTLEFASAGSVVVTTAWETKKDLSRYSDNILLTEPTPESMAAGLLEACDKINDHSVKASTHIGTDWSERLSKPLNELKKKLR